MLKVELQSWECPICFNQFEDPMIHNECGQTIDRHCIIESIQRHGRCPSCNVEATMEQFRPNVVVRDAIEELQRTLPPLVVEHQEKESAPPIIFPSFSPSVSVTEKKGFSSLMTDIKKRDPVLYNAHVKKESTKKLRVDWGNGYVAAFKSGNWHFYKIGQGAGPELCKHAKFEEGIKIIFPGRC